MKFGPFWLEARLAVGGTAEVYVARPIDAGTLLPRKLVVKRLLPHFVADPEGRTMFEREAALHAAVRHGNVVEVYGSGMHGDEPWLAMEWVDGCDLFRLLRRLANGGRQLPRGVAAHAARELLGALESVHGARDAAGQPMVIIHRDVTPSNIYLSADGRVKLGDFGIARSATRSTVDHPGGPILKGKFAYLAPEQVAGEGFDQRADLFATAVVLAEMILGRPLFAGSGQLAVLLAIRDCRIDPLRDARATFPAGLFEVLERALARDPANRFQTAAGFSEALAPFDSNPVASRAELGALVRWVQSAPSAEQMQAIRDSGAKLRAAAIARENPAGGTPASAAVTPPSGAAESGVNEDDVEADSERQTGEYAPIPSFVTTAAGDRLGPWPFARLIEAIATGDVGRGDLVEFMGRPATLLGSIGELARFLPALTAATTNRLAGVGVPDFVDTVSPGALVTVLVNVIESGSTGVLFAEGPTESRRVLAARDRVLGAKRAVLRVGQARAHRVEQRERAPWRVPGSPGRHHARGARLRARRPAPVRRPHGRHAGFPRPPALPRRLPRHPRSGPRSADRPVRMADGDAHLLQGPDGAAHRVPAGARAPGAHSRRSRGRRASRGDRGEAGATAWTTWSARACPAPPRPGRAVAAAPAARARGYVTEPRRVRDDPRHRLHRPGDTAERRPPHDWRPHRREAHRARLTARYLPAWGAPRSATFPHGRARWQEPRLPSNMINAKRPRPPPARRTAGSSSGPRR